MLQKGHFVITTNFDHLIEIALIKNGVKKDRIRPVITELDFINCSNPKK